MKNLFFFPILILILVSGCLETPPASVFQKNIHDLNQLKDVNTENLTDGSTLEYNLNDSLWEIGTDNLGTGSGTALDIGPDNVWIVGSGTALLGTNCPASTVAAPSAWLKVRSADGNILYIPAWK